MKKYISIDIGGTAIKYGIIGEDATVFSRDETPTRAEQGGPAILQRVIDLTEALLQTTPASGICISTAGMVDPVRGEIFYAAPLIPNYAGPALNRYWKPSSGCPVRWRTMSTVPAWPNTVRAQPRAAARWSC